MPGWRNLERILNSEETVVASKLEWVFKKGKKYPAGATRSTGVSPKKIKENVSSNGITKYFVILWNDGVLSCDCKGWAILKKDKDGKPKPRDCRHCKEARASKFEDMTPVSNFAPDSPMLQSKQLDFGERQLRNIRIRPERAST